MIVYLCDQCEKVILPEDLKTGRAQKKDGQCICSSCLSINVNTTGKAVEMAFCDRCHGSISLESLRNGSSLFIPQKGLESGKILCQRCRIMFERQSAKFLDLKLLGSFICLFFGIPLAIGLFLTLTKDKKNDSSKVEVAKPEERALEQEVKALKEQLQLINKALSAPQKEPTLPTPLPQRQESSKLQENNKSEKDEKNSEKKRSFKDISQLIEKKAVTDYIKPLKSQDSGERLQAILRLICARDRAGVPLLIECLKDDEPWIRNLAAKGLGVMGAKEAAPYLLNSLSDSNHFVKRSVAVALEKITNEKFIFFEDIPREDWEKLDQAKRWLEEKKKGE